MSKCPRYMKIDTEHTGCNQSIMLNISIKRWAFPFLAMQVFWKRVIIKPIILKPFLCLYFGMRMLLVGGRV